MPAFSVPPSGTLSHLNGTYRTVVGFILPTDGRAVRSRTPQQTAHKAPPGCPEVTYGGNFGTLNTEEPSLARLA
jgi:hypothetical protein